MSGAAQAPYEESQNLDDDFVSVDSLYSSDTDEGVDEEGGNDDRENSATSENVASKRERAQAPGEEELEASGIKESSFPRKEEESTAMPFAGFHLGNNLLRVRGKVSKRDGRLKLAVNERANRGYIANFLGTGLHRHLGTQDATHSKREEVTLEQQKVGREVSQAIAEAENIPRPKLNIVIMVIGSRGDIQPFIRIGEILKNEYGHRIRIATHTVFKKFVEEDCGLEHFDIGGDPSELMAFMVKNPGLIPSFDAVRKGEIGKRRSQMAEMFKGFWHSCVRATDGNSDRSRDDNDHPTPFVADAIISNPPVMIHVHCAERLGCPLHIMFTFPYTPTQQFPHPLANIKAGNVDESYTNFMSYPLVELMTWQGLGDLVNETRVNILGLEPVSTVWAPSQLYRLKVPYTYLWSPSLVPKPSDWGDEINIAGFVFLDLASEFTPPKDLRDFLEAGEPPVYIGFGSIVVDDPAEFTRLIFEAVTKAGVRALVNKGWGGIGDKDKTPDNIFMLDNVPHDWLFPRCSAVVHHGGAGTTAIGLKCAKPTVIVPFFGDQPFWGSMVAAAKAGAHRSLPYKTLTADKLAEAIKQCLTEEAKRNVQNIADHISREGDGAQNAVTSFLDKLPWRGSNSLRCSILEDQAAAWRLKGSALRLCPLAAELLAQNRISYEDLRLVRIYSWTDFQGAGAPIGGASTALFRTIMGFGKGILDGPLYMSEDIQKHAQYKKKKSRMKKKNEENKTATKQSNQNNGQSMDGTAESSNISDPKEIQNLKSEEPATRANTGSSTLSGAPEESLALEIGRDARSTIIEPMKVVAKAPMEIMLGLGQGLHNAPRLYGDETVRKPHRISGFRSGARAAGQEFTNESKDAVTGLFTHPYQGVKKKGAKGLLGGTGKAVGGLLLKGSSAVVTPFGYLMKGIHKEATKSRSPVGEVRDSRILQGRQEVEKLSNSQKEEVEQKVSQGLTIMRQLWEEGEKIKNQGAMGISGRRYYRREKKKWQDFGALESVVLSEKAMEARKRGIPFDEFMEQHRKAIQDSGFSDDEGDDEKPGWWGSCRISQRTGGGDRKLDEA